MIKNISTAILTAEYVRCLEASVSSGNRKVLRKLREQTVAVEQLTIPEKVAHLMDGVTSAENPLDYALRTYDQDFLDSEIPASLKKALCQDLISFFGPRANPLWRTYVAGNFKYIDHSEEM